MGALRRQRRWCVTNQKGGVGKSALAACLGYHAFEEGNRVLLVDADTQGSTVTAAMRMRLGSDRIGHLPELVPDKEAGGPAFLILTAMDASLLLGWRDGEGTDRFQPLEAMIEAFGPQLVLLDPPGRLDDMHQAVLLASEFALLVAGQGRYERDALLASADLVRSMQAQKPALQARLVLNHYKPGKLADKTEAAARLAEVPILRTKVRRRDALSDLFPEERKGLPPRGEAGEDIQALYQELLSL